MNAGVIVLIVCAGGYLVLALYGKYRKIRDEYHEAQAEQARRSEPPNGAGQTPS
jgi:hypothetical protein